MNDIEVLPKDHNEAVALFGVQAIGPLLCRDFSAHGELAEAVRALAQEAVRPPGKTLTRHYSATAYERWYYAYKKHGLAGLMPKSRSKGNALALTDAQRDLIMQIRRDHPRASAALIFRTLVTGGKIQARAASASTVRRLFAQHGLDRLSMAASTRDPRRRWEAAALNMVWHTDVCHGPALRMAGKAVPLRIHALLDDHSRYVVAIEARSDEREASMLALVVKATRQHGAPDVIYADNGSTFIGNALATACGRLGIGLIHAKPYDPQARGKMERFWRTLSDQCLAHCKGLPSLHDVQARLVAWMQKHYHCTPHSGLMGKTPSEVYEAHPRAPMPDTMLREALIVRAQRRVRRDGTLSIAGTTFELAQGYLAGRVVMIARSLLSTDEPPWVEYEEQRLPLHPVDAQANGKFPRAHRPQRGIDAVPFDPAGALLDQAVKGVRR